MTITLTPHVDFVPVPRVEVVFEDADLLVGTTTFTLRAVVGGRYFDVRGGVNRPVGSTVVLTDYQAAFQAPITYEVVCWAGAAALGTVVLGTVEVDYDGVVIQQPLDPKLWARVTLLLGTASALERGGRAELMELDGAVLPAVVGWGPRGGLVGVPFLILPESLTHADRLQATLGTYTQPQPQVWLVRTPAAWSRLPRLLFAHPAGFREVDYDVMLLDGEGSNVTFEASLSEVEQPAPALNAGALRYSDIEAVYPNYSDVEASYTLYSDILRDSGLVGAAG